MIAWTITGAQAKRRNADTVVRLNRARVRDVPRLEGEGERAWVRLRLAELCVDCGENLPDGGRWLAVADALLSTSTAEACVRGRSRAPHWLWGRVDLDKPVSVRPGWTSETGFVVPGKVVFRCPWSLAVELAFRDLLACLSVDAAETWLPVDSRQMVML